MTEKYLSNDESILSLVAIVLRPTDPIFLEIDSHQNFDGVYQTFYEFFDPYMSQSFYCKLYSNLTIRCPFRDRGVGA